MHLSVCLPTAIKSQKKVPQVFYLFFIFFINIIQIQTFKAYFNNHKSVLFAMLIQHLKKEEHHHKKSEGLNLITDTCLKLLFLCGSVVEHCISSAKGCGFDSQGTHLLMKMYNLNAIVCRFG